MELAKGVMEVAQRILAMPATPNTRCGRSTPPTGTAPRYYAVFESIAPPDLFVGAERYPRENAVDEKRLAEELLKAASLAPAEAAQAVPGAGSQTCHPSRAPLGRARACALAMALAQLASVAKAFQEASGGGQCDGGRSATRPAAGVSMPTHAPPWPSPSRPNLRKPIYAVLQALYRHWLEQQAEGFQALVKQGGYPHWSLPEVPDGTVVLFVDGLRLIWPASWRRCWASR
ncbi:hypothetical protein [Acidovorax sp.]|uniref:hypothetical protein n=1 Tax=Acidovorax sp. TaxID=1872122 RepID=UPI002ACD5809|nr:hypothetical protein [Acidovorax sp.]MDZ7862352.1 hypothetical protein [Acidovorax sp.]